MAPCTRHYTLLHSSNQQQHPHHHHPSLNHNYASMTTAGHDTPFTITLSIFAAAVDAASTFIPAATSSSMTPTAFQAALQSVVTRAAQAATRGSDTFPDGVVGRSYCWSHGYTQNVDHNSTTCRNKKTGHCNASTGTNRMNGKRFLYSIGRIE